MAPRLPGITTVRGVATLLALAGAIGLASFAAADTGDLQRDPYGGWTALKGQRTGFFHTQQIAGKWWFVTPDGNVFWSKGCCGVVFDADVARSLGYSPYNRAAMARYGSETKWATATAARLHDWGMNTLGAWSSPQMQHTGFAYTVEASLGGAADSELWRTARFPDVFSPEWIDAVDRRAAQLCRPLAADPWLLGYFSDYELTWGDDWRTGNSLLEIYLKMPPSTPGRKRAEQFVRDYGGSLTSAMKDEFLATVARQYFKVCHDAIHAHDPNHMVLGCRFTGFTLDPVLRAMRGQVDVVSYNYYLNEAPVKLLRRISAITGRPAMITEFSFKAMDSGLPNTIGDGAPVATQQERVDHLEAYVRGIARMPECVGYHWFEWVDEPKEGRPDGENSNYGLVRIDDTPYELLTARLRSMNRNIESSR